MKDIHRICTDDLIWIINFSISCFTDRDELQVFLNDTIPPNFHNLIEDCVKLGNLINSHVKQGHSKVKMGRTFLQTVSQDKTAFSPFPYACMQLSSEVHRTGKFAKDTAKLWTKDSAFLDVLKLCFQKTFLGYEITLPSFDIDTLKS